MRLPCHFTFSSNKPRPQAGRTLHERRSARRRKGAALIEFAVVAPVLFLLIFAVIEFGRVIMVEQIITNAAREGARRAILEQSTAADVQTGVTEYLTNNTISGATVTVSPDNLERLGFGAPVTVTVSVPVDSVSWFPATRWVQGATLSVQSVMRCERVE